VRLTQLAAAVAFNAVLALAPLLLLLLTLAGRLLGREAAQQELLDAAERLAGPGGSEVANTVMEMVVSDQSRNVATVVGAVLMLFFASRFFLCLKEALNAVWGLAPRRGLKRALAHRLLSMVTVVAFVIAALLILVLHLGGALAAPALVQLVPEARWLWELLPSLTALGLFTALLAVVFRYGPDSGPHWRDVWVSALLTALVLTGGNYVIGRFVGRSLLASFYGAASVLIVLLLWLYYSARILLFGAVLTRATSESFFRGSPPRPADPPPGGGRLPHHGPAGHRR